MSCCGNQVAILLESHGQAAPGVEVINVGKSPPSGRSASPFPRKPASEETKSTNRRKRSSEGSCKCVIVTHISVLISKGLSRWESKTESEFLHIVTHIQQLDWTPGLTVQKSKQRDCPVLE